MPNLSWSLFRCHIGHFDEVTLDILTKQKWRTSVKMTNYSNEGSRFEENLLANEFWFLFVNLVKNSTFNCFMVQNDTLELHLNDSGEAIDRMEHFVDFIDLPALTGRSLAKHGQTLGMWQETAQDCVLLQLYGARGIHTFCSRAAWYLIAFHPDCRTLVAD